MSEIYRFCLRVYLKKDGKGGIFGSDEYAL